LAVSFVCFFFVVIFFSNSCAVKSMNADKSINTDNSLKKKILKLVRSSKTPVNTSAKKLAGLFSSMYNDSTTDTKEFFSDDIWNDISNGSEWKPDVVNALRVMMSLTTVVRRLDDPLDQLKKLLIDLKEEEFSGCYHGIAIFLFSGFCNDKGVSRNSVLCSFL